MNQHELSSILEKHKKWLSNKVGGIRADLRDHNLEGVNLRGANLYQANLREANLRGANLAGAKLRYINLREADLRGANLRNCDLTEANLRGANLTNVKSDYKLLETINNLKYPILFINDQVTVGCQTHYFKEWLEFPDSDIYAMDTYNALNFYPILVDIIQSVYQI